MSANLGRGDALIETFGRMIDRFEPTIGELRAHGLQLLAAHHLSQRGRVVPPELLADWVAAARTERETAALLARVRDAVEGPIVLLKGPEVTAHYPIAGLRTWADLDVLVPEPERAWERLRRSGFSPAGDTAHSTHHHLQALANDSGRLPLEVHRGLSRPLWATGPSAEEILLGAVPTRTGHAGFLAPEPAAHAVYLAAHSWGHLPFRSARDLIEEELLVPTESDQRRAERLAGAWGLGRVWTKNRKLVHEIEADVGCAQRDRDFRRYPLTGPVRSLRDRSVARTLAAVAAGPLFADDGRSILSGLIRSTGRVISPWASVKLFDRKRINARRV